MASRSPIPQNGSSLQFRVIYDTLVSARECRTRSLPHALSRMVICGSPGSNEASDSLVAISACLDRWRPTGEALWLIPMITYCSEQQTIQTATASGLDAVDRDLLFRHRGEHPISDALDALDCEEIAMFYCKSEAEARDVMARSEAYDGDEKSLNTRIIAATRHLGVAMFFAQSHRSLEVFGNSNFVVNVCLSRLLQLQQASAAGDD